MSNWKCRNCGEVIEGQFDDCWNCQFSRSGLPPRRTPRPADHEATAQPEPTFPFIVRLYRASFGTVAVGVGLLVVSGYLESAAAVLGLAGRYKREVLTLYLYLSITTLCAGLLALLAGRLRLGRESDYYGVKLRYVVTAVIGGALFATVPTMPLLVVFRSHVPALLGAAAVLLYTWYWAGSTGGWSKQRRETAARVGKEILSGGGTQYFGSVIAKQSREDLDALCEEFHIRTDLTDRLSTDNSFQAATFTARILADYEGFAREFDFPNPGYDWRRLSEKLVKRIIDYSRLFKGRIAPIYRDQIYELAIQLLQRPPHRSEEALALFEISAPSTKTDHFFWIFACKHNLAVTTGDRARVEDARKMGREILSGSIRVPDSKREGVGQMLERLGDAPQ